MVVARLCSFLLVAIVGCRPAADLSVPASQGPAPTAAGAPAVGAEVCETGPEDLDGFEDDDDCADLDNDQDGVVDEQDRCPNEPEDIDGFEDDDGCHDDAPAVLPAEG